MNESQTRVEQDTGKDEPAGGEDHGDRSSGTYYYDDTTGYEIYDENADESDAEEDPAGSEASS